MSFVFGLVESILDAIYVLNWKDTNIVQYIC